MKDFWDHRYQEEEYAYSTKPNEYLKQVLPKYTPGTILFPADGEGRNSVYAATLGWEAYAFDISIEGERKAQKLASDKHTVIHYQLSALHQSQFPENHYEAIALIYSHFPFSVRQEMYQWIHSSLCSKGVLIIEAFSVRNLEYQTINPYIGGPSDPDMLYTVNELITAFSGFDIIHAEECEVKLHEGKYHNGFGSVVRFEATKP